MMALKEHFEFVDYAMGSSTIFRCIKPIQAGMGAMIRALPFEKHEALLDEAIATAPDPIVPVLKCSKAMFYTAHQMPDRALSLLSTVSVERKTTDWAIDFSGVAAGSRDTGIFFAGLPGEQLALYGISPP